MYNVFIFLVAVVLYQYPHYFDRSVINGSSLSLDASCNLGKMGERGELHLGV